MTKSWEEIVIEYPVGSVIEGIVEHHAPFGVFLYIGEIDFQGLIQIVDFKDDIKSLEDYPKIGEKVSARIVGHTMDDRKQIWLSLK